MAGGRCSQLRSAFDSDSDLEEISPSRSGGGSGGRGSASADKVKLVKGQVDEVVGIMRTNIAKTIERGDRLDVLVDKTGAHDLAQLLIFPHRNVLRMHRRARAIIGSV